MQCSNKTLAVVLHIGLERGSDGQVQQEVLTLGSLTSSLLVTLLIKNSNKTFGLSGFFLVPNPMGMDRRPTRWRGRAMDTDKSKAGETAPGLGLQNEWKAVDREGRGMMEKKIILPSWLPRKTIGPQQEESCQHWRNVFAV